ncbi:MAG TPA: hypothetical protein VHG27_10630 [Xanthobacteraceae bacterium]|nr:hypothetical protein [Xanthobacteraceae bacterium]
MPDLDACAAAARYRRRVKDVVALGVVCGMIVHRFVGMGLAVLGAAIVGGAPAVAADLVWKVENPFRLYRHAASFDLHERAFAAVRGAQDQALPLDIVSRIERHLNAPDCRDPSTAITCAATVRNAARFQTSRLGWAAKTLDTVCYDTNVRPRRYPSTCARTYSGRTVREDYILPTSHVVSIGLSDERQTQAGDGECRWTWRPRAGGAPENRTQPCSQNLTISQVPFATERARSGVAVEVELPDGAKLAEPDVVVEDLLVVALGDSFASGESNPDKPVTFGNREFVYETIREEVATVEGGYSLQSAPEPPALEPTQNPRALPRRLLEDEERGLIYRRSSPEFLKAFYQRSAEWLSPDCHRSQYGYPVRVALQLALEDRHRAITLVHLACSGAQVTEGLFVPQEAREGFDKPNSASVPAQFDQLNDLICRDAAPARSQQASYKLPFYKPGQAAQMRTINKRWCAPERRKRGIDLVLLSVGGNDVGFSPVAAYAMTESAGDIAPIAAWLGQEIRFPPDAARRYLDVLDERLKAVKEALQAGFGVGPERVVQTSYEPIQYDETGALCGARPALGMDVHPHLKIGRERLQQAAQFFDALLQRLECITDANHRGCRGRLATGGGTGFTLVTEHQAAFRRRGLCARDPKRADADGAAMAMPRFNPLTAEFKPYHPAYYAPYASKWRLFRTPNDAFLTANTHQEKVLLYDILQPVYAALYSGAIHPTAEGHAIVADHVMPHARRVVEKKR